MHHHSTFSNAFIEEIADQLGIFFSIVFGFICANAMNSAIRKSIKCDETHQVEWLWIYAMLTLIVGVFFMAMWSYFIAKRKK